MNNRLTSFASSAGLVLGLLSLLSAGASRAGAQAQGPALQGNWVVTFRLEPGHSEGATRCFQFTQTGGVLGEPKSGTFVETTFPNWKGRWIQEGDHVLISGNAGSGNEFHVTQYGHLVSAALLAGEAFTDDDVERDVLDQMGAWSGRRLGTSCSAAGFVPSAPRPGASPTQK